MKIYIKLEAPFEWVRMEESAVQAFGEVASLTDYPNNNEDEMVAIVSGEWVTAHHVTLPAKTRKQFMAALPYALEESMSEDVENIHFVCPQWKMNEACVVYVVAKDKMQEWQELARKNELPIVELLPDYSLLPSHEAAECSLSLNVLGGLLTKQKDGLGAYIEEEFIDVWLQEFDSKFTVAVNNESLTEQLIKDYPSRDFRFWPFGDKPAHWLEHLLGMRTINLLSKQYQPPVGTKSLRQFLTPAIIFLSGLLLLCVYDIYRYVDLAYEKKQIETKMVEVVKSTFPDVDVVIVEKERFIMEQAIARTGGRLRQSDFQTLIAITARVMKIQGVSLSDLSYRNQQLVITSLLDDFSQADKIVQQFNRHKRVIAELESSSANGTKITARYSIKQR